MVLTAAEFLAFEKEMLGLYVSDHPLFGVEGALRAVATSTIGGLGDAKDGEAATVGGIVGGITRRYTKNGEPMIFFQLEDLGANVEIVCFPKTVAAHGTLVRPDAILVVSGRVDQRGDSVKVIAQGLSEPDLSVDRSVRLRVPAVRMSHDLVARLRSVLENHPGDTYVFVHMAGDGGADTVVRLGDEHRVEPRTALYAELRELLGPAAILR